MDHQEEVVVTYVVGLTVCVIGTKSKVELKMMLDAIMQKSTQS
jgi:hypothetical protein